MPSPQDYEEAKKCAKAFYEEIGIVKTSALGGAKVVFTSAGFNHLLRRGRKFRPKSEQMKRLSLLRYARAILTDPGASVRHRKLRKQALVQYWSFTKHFDGQRVKLIVRQIGAGQKHFYSIMS